ncbi:MAG: SRPBCC family protein [Pseudomonadota bacterium]
MHEILIEKTLSAPMKSVWALLEDFANLDWYPPAERVEAVEEDGNLVRRIFMHGMDTPVDEKLEAIDATQMQFSYTIPGMPMQNYRVVVNLSPNGGNTDVRWHAVFTSVSEGINADDMVALMTDTYGGMLLDLEKAASQHLA